MTIAMLVAARGGVVAMVPVLCIMLCRKVLGRLGALHPDDTVASSSPPCCVPLSLSLPLVGHWCQTAAGSCLLRRSLLRLRLWPHTSPPLLHSSDHAITMSRSGSFSFRVVLGTPLPAA